MELKKIIEEKVRHKFYKESCDKYDELRIHYTKEFPGDIIKKARPNESETIRKYREDIYKCVTHSAFMKVINSLQKIRKSQDYVIKFKAGSSPASVASEETLEEYTVKDFPNHDSLDNWFWNVGFVQYCLDAGAISVTTPIIEDVPANGYVRPYPTIYNSPQVLWYDYMKEYWLLSNEKSYWKDEKGGVHEGNIYIHVDKIAVTRWEQTDDKGNFRKVEYFHGTGECPVVHFNGTIEKDGVKQHLFRSRISPMLPEFQEAIREYSDHQAEIIQHIHSTVWAMEAQKCKTCDGVGKIKKQDASGTSKTVTCHACKGKALPFNPYETFIVGKAAPGEPNAPTPPIGYLSKPTDIAKLQDQRIQDHIYRGLAALNFEFLASVPLAQSGIAKDFDRAEPNNFVYQVAEDCVRIIDSHFEITCDERYMVIVPSKETRDEMLPEISVPEKYDIVPDSYLADQIEKLKRFKASPQIISAAEIEYVNKKFNTNPELKKLVTATYALDMQANVPDDTILANSSNGLLSKEAGVIHANIREFVELAIEDNPEFLNLPLKEQRVIIKGKAKEWIAANSAASRVDTTITDPTNVSGGA